MTIAGANYREGIAFSPDGAMYVTPSGSSVISGGTIDNAVIGGTTPAAITGTTILAGDGSATAPSFGWSSDNDGTGTGLYRRAANLITGTINGTASFEFGATTFDLLPTTQLRWQAVSILGAPDLVLARSAAGVLGVHGVSTAVLASIRRYGGNAGYVEWGSVSENLTLSTSGTTTDTSANLLPADSYIESVTARVTTTVATATSWQVGDPTTAGRFTAAQSGAQLTAGATVVGLVHCDVTGAGGPRQTSAAKVRITTVGTPSAGAIRLTSYYRTFVAPTS